MNYNEKRPIIENKRIIFSIIILFYVLKYILYLKKQFNLYRLTKIKFAFLKLSDRYLSYNAKKLINF